MKRLFEYRSSTAHLLVHAVLLAGAVVLVLIIVASPDVLALAS